MFQICRPTQADSKSIGIMYCIMFCLRLSGIEKAPFAPHPRKYWNYVLHCYATLAECQVLTRTLQWPLPPTPTSILIVYCIMFFPTLPGQLTNVPQPCQVLPPCIGIMYCIRSDYHCLFRRNKTQQHNYLLSVGISHQPSPRLDVLCFETYTI